MEIQRVIENSVLLEVSIFEIEVRFFKRAFLGKT